MNNRAVAKVFEDIATLLQLKGESAFKWRAYQRAAETLGNYPGNLGDLADDLDALKAIPGVGDAIALKIQELVQTGKLRFFEDLKAEFPEGLLELMEVPGIGPKTALRAAEDLGIRSVDDLEKSIESGTFEKLPRVGHKNAENILRHLHARRRRSDRVMLGRALPLAEDIIGQLKKAAPAGSRFAVAGSARRWKETVGDLDLLCTTKHPDAIMSAFLAIPGIEEVLVHGESKTSVVLENGLQIDLRVEGDEYWGALLLYFTGSQQHGIQLRTRALRLGFSLNEYGLTKTGTDKLETFPDETSIYKRLGLPYIPPELREGSGEIEAAEARKLPELIELPDIRGDLHVHSDWSDGRVSLEDMVEAAMERGREYIAMTDHSSGRGIANGLTVERLAAHNREIDEVSKRHRQIRIYKGTEIDIRADGALDYGDEVLDTLDVVIASVHSAMGQKRDVMTDRILRAMRNPHVTAIGHLTTRLIFDGERSRDPIDADFDAIFKAAADTSTFLEINASPYRLDLKDAHVRAAQDAGARFLINTDAHDVQGLDDMRYGVGTARRGWCERSRVVNHLPAKEFEEVVRTPKPERERLLKTLD